MYIQLTTIIAILLFFIYRNTDLNSFEYLLFVLISILCRFNILKEDEKLEP